MARLRRATKVDDVFAGRRLAAVELVSHSNDPPHAGLADYDRAPDGCLTAGRAYE